MTRSSKVHVVKDLGPFMQRCTFHLHVTCSFGTPPPAMGFGSTPLEVINVKKPYTVHVPGKSPLFAISAAD